MAPDTTQSTLANDFDDFKVFSDHKRLNKEELFDEHFLVFMQWLKKDIHTRYTKADFQRIELRMLLELVGGYSLVFLIYVGCFLTWPDHPLVWGIPLFVAAIACATRAEVVHMRTHSPANLTGVAWIDRFVDRFGLATSGVSPNLLKRRHLAAHYNDIGLSSKLFSNVWLTFDKVPLQYYLKPWVLLRFILDRRFCEAEMIDRRLLVFETLTFYLYLGAMAAEVWWLGSYFLVVFHLIPGLIVSSAQVAGAMMVHSGNDPRNSFESNALLDPDTAKGLFAVPLKWFAIFNSGFFVNHAIHHAYPQIPLVVLNQEYKRYYEHILSTYPRVRYNKVAIHSIHGRSLEKLSPPGPLDYVVALGLTWFTHAMLMLTSMGIPLPPPLFEQLLVDWRLFTQISRRERTENRVMYLEQVGVPTRYHEIANPNTYLKFYYKLYHRWKAELQTRPAVNAP